VALGHLGAAVRADFWEPGHIRALGRVWIVPAAEGAVADHMTIAPALRESDVPDVLAITAEAKRGFWYELFRHWAESTRRYIRVD
jgi:hypothetical protein